MRVDFRVTALVLRTGRQEVGGRCSKPGRDDDTMVNAQEVKLADLREVQEVDLEWCR